ncbi:MAG: hypothetical protein JJ992_09115 [Planctomycetes bacterium]|nr:hypothetical protein [Planctomycetota bacterium]
MTSQRLVTLGVVLLLLGIQLRLVDTFVLNEKASRIVQQRLNRSTASGLYETQPTSLGTYADPFDTTWTNDFSGLVAPARQSYSPPRWLGLSLISVGAVLILTNPCYRS